MSSYRGRILREAPQSREVSTRRFPGQLPLLSGPAYARRRSCRASRTRLHRVTQNPNSANCPGSRLALCESPVKVTVPVDPLAFDSQFWFIVPSISSVTDQERVESPGLVTR